ncbi:MAG: hypothetical protein WBB01_10690 [Phormidesmis sp.]
MRKKSFVCIIIGAISVVCTSCGRVEKPVQEVADRETVIELQDENTRYFEEDLYVTSSGEKLPINAIRAELLCAVSPGNFRKVAERADAIAIGKPLESLEESEIKVHDDITRYEFSVSDFAVETVLKGSFQDGDVIRLGQDVAILDDESYRLPVGHEDWHERSLVLSTPNNYRPVKPGSKYILFLHKRTDVDADVYFPIYYALGRFNVDGTDEINYEPYIEMPVYLKIQDYAIALYQATVRDPKRNSLDQLVRQSDSDFSVASPAES